MRSLVSLAVVCFLAPSAAADEAYLLKIEETGYDRVVSEKETPQSEPGPSIELLVQPDEPFTLRLESSGKKMEISGLLRVADGAYRLEWSDVPNRKLGGSEPISKDPQVIDLRQKITEMEMQSREVEELITAQSVAKGAEGPAVQRIAARRESLQKTLDSLRRQLAALRADDGVANVRLELGQPKVIKSIASEVAKGDGLWQKFRRETTVTLRPTAADRARALSLDFMRQHRAATDRVLREQVFPAGFHDQIHKGMMIDAIQHELRIQKRIHDQKYLPTTFEHNKIEVDSPIRKLVPEKRKN